MSWMPEKRKRISNDILFLFSGQGNPDKESSPVGKERKKRPTYLQDVFLEALPGFEPGVKVLQTSALPLGYGASSSSLTELICSS
jgi:hypothetical protein